MKDVGAITSQNIPKKKTKSRIVLSVTHSFEPVKFNSCLIAPTIWPGKQLIYQITKKQNHHERRRFQENRISSLSER
jgi:hypothetical protein